MKEIAVKWGPSKWGGFEATVSKSVVLRLWPEDDGLYSVQVITSPGAYTSYHSKRFLPINEAKSLAIDELKKRCRRQALDLMWLADATYTDAL